MSFSAWLSELNRILIVFVPCVIFGIATGYLPLFFILGLIIYGLWTARQLVTLKKWLDDGAVINDAPEYLGIADQHVSSIVDLQKNTETNHAKLIELIDQFSLMISALPDAVVIMAATGEILSANQAAHKLLQIDPSKDTNTRITQLIRYPSFTDYFFAGKFDQPLEIHSVSTNEPELSVRIISFGEDKLVLIAQDMTQAARIHEMRRSFISNASHELRTPLTVISGYLETLSNKTDLSEGSKAAVQAAEQQTVRMRQLVEDLLTLSRLESTAIIANEVDIIPVAHLIKEVIEEAKQTVWYSNHNIEIQVETDALLKGDVQEIHSVISNLVNNAVKHTDAGTNIKVIWRMVDGKFAELVVEDDGEGIESEHIGRLTERFYRVDAGRSREKGGTGLGLSIVKHIIGRHEGELIISSEYGKGAVFCCRFPQGRLTYSQENI